MKLPKRKLAMKLLAPLLALLLVLAGCDAVGGADLNKALTADLNARSSESNLTFSLEALPAAGATEEDLAIIEGLNSFALTIDSAKLQQDGTASASGVISYNDYEVPMSMYMDATELVFTAEGAARPFVLPLWEYGDVTALVGAFDPQKAEELSALIGQFVVGHLPNPAVIQASSVTESVYGESLSLTKVHAEIKGDELAGLAKQFLKSVSEDTEGFKELLGAFYDYMLPVLEAEGIAEALESGTGMKFPLEDKEGIVTVLHDASKLLIDTLLLMYDSAVDSLMNETPEMKTVLGPDTKLSVDLFLDSQSNIRKQQMLFDIALPGTPDFPLSGLKISAESEVWNIGGAVTADVLSSANAIDLNDYELTDGDILNNFDPASDAYRFLKEESGLGSIYIGLWPDDDYYYPVVVEGTTMVPIRYLAYDFDAELEWKSETGEIVITDSVYGTTLTFKVGSDIMLLDGQSVQMPQAVFIDEYGDGYVSLRAFAEGLGATVTTDSDGYINIERY